LPPSLAASLEIWEPQPLGTLGAFPGLYRDLFTVLPMPYTTDFALGR